MIKLFPILMLFFLPGCAVLEEHGPDIEQLGETLTEVAPVVNTGLAQPDIGLGILIVGGLLIALGKQLQRKKK